MVRICQPRRSWSAPKWTVAILTLMRNQSPPTTRHGISKVTMRMPTLLPFGEGCMSGEAIDTSTRSIRRGSGHGVERKGQFGLGRLGVQGQPASEVWNAVLGA